MKKFLFTSCLFMLVTTTLTGQFWTNSLKLIAKGEYADAEKKIVKTLNQSPNDVEENFAMAVMLSKRNYSGFNTEKSYEHLIKSATNFRQIKDDKEIKRLAKIPITEDDFNNMTDTICRIVEVVVS